MSSCSPDTPGCRSKAFDLFTLAMQILLRFIWQHDAYAIAMLVIHALCSVDEAHAVLGSLVFQIYWALMYCPCLYHPCVVPLSPPCGALLHSSGLSGLTSGTMASEIEVVENLKISGRQAGRQAGRLAFEIEFAPGSKFRSVFLAPNYRSLKERPGIINSSRYAAYKKSWAAKGRFVYQYIIRHKK